MKIYVVGGDKYYVNWIKNHEIVHNLEEADIVYFTGGEDVSPVMYGCKKHPTTYSNINRDAYEKEVFDSVRPDQLVMGTCRGLKLRLTLNAVNCWNAEMPISSQA